MTDSALVTDNERRIARARVKSLEARTRLAATMSEIQGRLTPKVLMREAWEEVRALGGELTDEGLEAAKARPWTVATVVAATVLFLGRGPLWRVLIDTIFRNEEPAAVEDGSVKTRKMRSPGRRTRAIEEKTR